MKLDELIKDYLVDRLYENTLGDNKEYYFNKGT